MSVCSSVTSYFCILSYRQLDRARLPESGVETISLLVKSNHIKEVNQATPPRFLVTCEDMAVGFFSLNMGD